MALGTAVIDQKVQAGQGGGPIRVDCISFPGDGAYPAGGTPGFEAYVIAALNVGNVDILAVIPGECGGYVPVYDRENDKLKVYYGNNDGGADGPMIDNATADLSAVEFNLVVLTR